MTAYAFDDFILDVSTFTLVRRAETLPIQPKALDVLLYLIRHRDRVVSKAELLENVWPHVTVSEPSLVQAILVLRRAVADDGEEQRIVRTVRGRGYRFVAPLREVTHTPIAVSPPPQPASLDAAHDAFVGREGPLAHLVALLDLALAGRGAVATIAGDAGIGKTRLLEELCAVARVRGARVLHGRAFEGGGAPPLWPWVQAVRSFLEDEEAPEIEAAITDQLAQLVPGLRGDGATQAPPEDVRVFQALTRFLRAVAAKQPVVVALEDVHLADVPTLLALRFSAHAFGAARVLLVATFRENALASDATLARTLGTLRRETPKGHVELRGLDLDSTSRLARALLGRPAAAEIVARLHAKTAGNPLFLTQLLHVIASEEWLGTGDAISTSALLAQDSMREAVRLQLEALPEAVLRVLGTAAVFGPEFPIAGAAALVGLTPVALLETLDGAFRARLVRKRSPSTVRFMHALVRDALYAGLQPAERVHLHAGAAAALLAHGPAPTGAQIGLVAHHFAEGAAACDAAEVATWAARAAKWQLSNGAPLEAIASLEAGALGVEVSSCHDTTKLADAERELADLALAGPVAATATGLLTALRRHGAP